MSEERAPAETQTPASDPAVELRTAAEKRRDELVEEGVLVAMAALRMKVKNRTIVWMLRDGNPWSNEVVRDMVRDELGNLADELLREADRLAALRPKAARRIGRSQHQYDYGQEDVYLLRQRENTNRSVAEKLVTLADDDAAVDAVAVGVKHDNLMEIVSAAPLPFEPRPDETLDPEQQKRAIAAIEAELRMMLATAEAGPTRRGLPTVIGGRGAVGARGTTAMPPARPWWKRLRQGR